MRRQIVRDIKGIYHSVKEERCYRCTFERKLKSYIKNRAPSGSVNWEKLHYEFRNIYRKCRDHNRPSRDYLQAMATITKLALAGQHKKEKLDVEKIWTTS